MSLHCHEVLFLHWPFEPDIVRPMIPAGLELDTFNGSAWISVVAVRMTGVRPRYFPVGVAFPEIDVRTYVWTPGRSGVWFFSLDATSRLAVRSARLAFGLPYYDARVAVRSEPETVHYQSTRTDRSRPGAEFSASCKPTGPAYRSAPETLDRWLTDRYCLYAVDRAGRLGSLEIHHLPWPLQHAEVELRANSMTKPLEIDLPKVPPLAHFARHLEVIAWRMVPVEGDLTAPSA
jgi:uncharacterized protein YqjF (DUF2071 family)